MAPEVVLGGAEGPLSDQYRLGILMYECASGVNPFALDDPHAVLGRITTGEVEPLSSRKPLLSKALIALIERSMHVDPARRFPNMLVLGARALCRGGASHPYHVGPRLSRGQREARRRGVAAAASRPVAFAPSPAPAALRVTGRWPPWRWPPASRCGTSIRSRGVGVKPRAKRPRSVPRRTSSRPSPVLRCRSRQARRNPYAARSRRKASSLLRETPRALAVMALPQSQPLPPATASRSPAPFNARQHDASATRGARSVSSRPKPITPASEQPAPDAAPDWMLPSDSPSPQPVFQRGTNEALILD